MQILSNYASCFANDEGGQDFQPYLENGALKIICTNCEKEAITETNGSEKRFGCTCYNGFKFSCSFAFYDEMVAAAATI